jgi:hypothetical protein
MSVDIVQKSILALGDDEMLLRVIELALVDHSLEISSILIESPECQALGADFGCVDLIILALSSFSSEPVVALTKASLTNVVGQIPLLIISRKRFRHDRDVPIYHLDFPFDVRELQARVHKVLSIEPV